MPFIFRYKNFVIRFWYSFEERRRHVHAISENANVKIWLEPVIEIASVKGHINESMLHELLEEVKKMKSFASLLGINTSAEQTAFLGSTVAGIAILVHGREFFLKYTDFPWFEYCNSVELSDMTADRWGVYWNSLDIDLSIESIEDPARFPEKISVDAWLKARHKNAARLLGSIRSSRKAAASRRNGAKGGRPRKDSGSARA